MDISFEQIGQQFLTFGCDDSETLGTPCVMASNGTVETAVADDIFIGVISTLRDGAASVLVHGFCQLPYSGTAPSLGYCALVADGDGGVTADTDGRDYLVLDVNTTDHLVGIYL